MLRIPGRSEPFVTLLPATEENRRVLTDCFGPMAQVALASLYLRSGRYMPALAKARGVYLGLCDAVGMRVEDNRTATHIGITAGDADVMEERRHPLAPPTLRLDLEEPDEAGRRRVRVNGHALADLFRAEDGWTVAVHDPYCAPGSALWSWIHTGCRSERSAVRALLSFLGRHKAQLRGVLA